MEYSKDNFLNRELSWLEFNGRVLEQAEDKSNPLLERLKFLSITSSNLDEFFMIRVAGLKAQIQSEYNQQDISGLTPKEQLQKVEKATIELVKNQYTIYNNKLLKELKKEKIEIIDYSELTKREEEIVERYFQEIIFPIVTPMAIDSSRRFPHLSNK
ncbi:MAG: RNA degradosome polyphosphate kinase, partial [Leptotrichiaceae bacterium]